MDSHDDEVELWLRARHDGGGAFAALFDLHHARIYRRTLGLLGNVHDAEEVAAAAFFELWWKRRSVTVTSSVPMSGEGSACRQRKAAAFSCVADHSATMIE